jgi:hypothetical protein
MKTLVIYGNCQAQALQFLLQEFCTDVQVVPLQPVHLLNRNRSEDVHAIVATADYFLFQPVSSGYGPLSTDVLRTCASATCRLVSFASLHFNGYYPRQIYLRANNGERVVGPIGDYHDTLVIEGFLNDLRASQIVEQLENASWTAAQHRSAIDMYINHFRNREQNVTVQLTSYLEAHLDSQLQFYTFNHPANALLIEVARQALEQLDISGHASFSTLQQRKDLLANYYFQADGQQATKHTFAGPTTYRANQRYYSRIEAVESWMQAYGEVGKERLATIYAQAQVRRDKVLNYQLVE